MQGLHVALLLFSVRPTGQHLAPQAAGVPVTVLRDWWLTIFHALLASALTRRLARSSLASTVSLALKPTP